MIFNRTSRYRTPLTVEEIKHRLLGKHIQVHHLDFEVLEKENILKVIPHAENINSVKTLPITHIEMQAQGNSGTRVTVTSKPRRIDVGAPYLIVIFCLFCIIGASIFYFTNPTESYWPPIVMVSIGLFIFIVFWLRMESGYFDYTRKIRDYIKHHVK